jgi:hypothetical protein
VEEEREEKEAEEVKTGSSVATWVQSWSEKSEYMMRRSGSMTDEEGCGRLMIEVEVNPERWLDEMDPERWPGRVDPER